MNWNRGQGTFEYLLLIASAVIVSTVVMSFLFSVANSAMLEDNLIQYDDTTDIYPPEINLSLTQGEGSIILSLAGSDDSGKEIQYSIVRAENPIYLEQVNESSDLSSLPPGVTLVSTLTMTSGSFEDLQVTPKPFYYKIIACDQALPNPNCMVSPTGSMAPGWLPFTVNMGSTEIVFDYTTDKCPGVDLHLPDTHARAIDTGDGSESLILNATNSKNYSFRGSNFVHVTPDCTQPTMTGTDSIYPYTFNNQEWLSTIYKVDNVIYGIVHNEFHDPLASAYGCPASTGPNSKCWYNSLTLAKSIDNGYTYAQDETTTAPYLFPNLVAAPVESWDPASMFGKPYGYMEPSNIISKKEGSITYYYTLFRSIRVSPGEINHVCLMRTWNLSDPHSWRAWDGHAFTILMAPAYNTSGQPIVSGAIPCAPISLAQLRDHTGGITYNNYFKKYMIVFSGIMIDYYVDPIKSKCGMWFALSNDLIHWSNPHFMFESNMPFDNENCPGGTFPDIAYGTGLDHDQLNQPEDPNFEISDETFHVYYTHFHGGLDRDLVRRSVTITSP